MRSSRTVLCLLGAFIGAGFASGREIMRFFTRYGPLSVPLILLTGMLITGVIRHGLCGGGLLPVHTFLPGRIAMLLLFLAAGGGMAAAAGELWALTVPLRNARGIGLLLSLFLCLLAAGKPESALPLLSYLLLPVLLLALMLCLRAPAPESAALLLPAPPDILCAVIGCFSYAGLNGVLALGILNKAGHGCSRRKNCRCAVWAGGIITGLLLLFDRALQPHAAELRDAPLPLVQLLRVYGIEGYYLAAAALYLAVITTLIAVLRTLRDEAAVFLPRFAFPVVGLTVAAVSLCGFERIVAVAYPALGLIGYVLLFPFKSRKTAHRKPPITE